MATWKWWIATPSSMWKSCPLTLTRRWTLGVTDGDVFRCPKKTTDVGQGKVFWCFPMFFLILIEVLDVGLQEIKVITVCVFTKELVAQVHFVPFAGVAFFVWLDSNWASLFWSCNIFWSHNKTMVGPGMGTVHVIARHCAAQKAAQPFSTQKRRLEFRMQWRNHQSFVNHFVEFWGSFCFWFVAELLFNQCLLGDYMWLGHWWLLAICLLNHQQTNLGGAFKYFFYFQPYLGKIPILTNIFHNGLKPRTN